VSSKIRAKNQSEIVEVIYYANTYYNQVSVHNYVTDIKSFSNYFSDKINNLNMAVTRDMT